MNKILEEINQLYLQIQSSYLNETPNLNDQTHLEPNEIKRTTAENSNIYNTAINKFVEVAPSLSPAEIIDGYEQGCILLQRNISGHMCHYFDVLYIPIDHRTLLTK